MIRREDGFTLVELIITMLIFVLVIAASSNIFSSLLNQFKQQSKIAETSIEGAVVLDMMRVDIQQAGFGIPWNLETVGAEDGLDAWTTLAGNYREAVSNAGGNADPSDASYYNDGTPASALPAPAQQRAPRGVLAQNRVGIMPNTANTPLSDYLVVKATSLGINAAAQKWTHITNFMDDSGNTWNLDPRVWNDTNNPVNPKNAVEDLVDGTDQVIVQRPAMGPGGAQMRVLITSTAAGTPAFSALFHDTAAAFLPAAFQPVLGTGETHFIYGVGLSALRAPFNRADFYVSRPPANVPAQCAPNTGILYKAVMTNSTGMTGGQFTELPILDCVADMQVVFITDVDNNGTPEWNNADFPYTGGLNAQQIRSQLRGVVVYILAHEGQIDHNYTFSNFSAGCAGVANCIRVGDLSPTGTLLGREFDLSVIGANFLNYRWKIYTISVKLLNLG